MTATRRRSGVTLMEVLLATFIMAIGMLAIMALFPIGAVNFARAINQDRAATHGVNADNTFRFYWKQAWTERNPPFLGQTFPSPGPPTPNDPPPWAPIYGPPTGSYCASTEAAYQNSQEPMLLLLEAHPMFGHISGNGNVPAPTNQPSFPVLVDPIGWQTKQLATQQEMGFVAGNPRLPVRTTLRRAINLPYRPHTPPDALPPPALSGFPRQVPMPGAWPAAPPYWNHPLYPAPPQAHNPLSRQQPYPPDNRVAIRLTTLLDDMTFAKENDTANTPAQYVAGEPATPSAQLERGGRYTASWLIQRVRNDAPGEVNLHILVYAGRSPTDTPSAETAFAAITGPGTKTIAVDLGGQAPPALRRGGWVGFSMAVTPQPTGVTYPTLDFYRIVAVDDSTPNTLVLELETAVKTQGALNAAGNYMGLAIVFDNLVEVFDRGIVTPTGHAVK